MIKLQRSTLTHSVYQIGLSGLLGLGWGGLNQPLPGLLRSLPGGGALWIGWMGLVWPLAFGIFLLALTRISTPPRAALAGGCFLGGAVLGWFGCHLILLGLGFGPPGTQWTIEGPDSLSYLTVFIRQTVLGRLVPAIGLGATAGGLAGWVGQYWLRSRHRLRVRD